MKPAPPENKDAIRIEPPRRHQRATWLFALVAVLGLAVLGSAGFWFLRPSPPQSVQGAVAPAPVSPPSASAKLPPPATAKSPAFEITTATEAEINAHVSTSLSLFQFADNPWILVLDFASLRDQGKMLNRVAAYAEKAGLPHDRVLTEGELAAAIAAQGETVETFYYGHDYSAATLRRFFETADRQRIELDPQEELFRAILRQIHWLQRDDVRAGVISVPAANGTTRITPDMRATILRHELSHGEFFSNSAYAEYVHNFWLQEMSGEERAAVRGFLARNDYDLHAEEVMYNEMQAYLMFTRDPAFFTPDQVGMTSGRLATLQARFLAGMPAGWLRDLLAGTLGTAAAR